MEPKILKFFDDDFKLQQEFTMEQYKEIRRSAPPQTLHLPHISRYLERCIGLAGTPSNRTDWKSLRRHCRVDGMALAEFETPRKEYLGWLLGHHLQKKDDQIVWRGINIEGGKHCESHFIKIWRYGKIEGNLYFLMMGFRSLDKEWLEAFFPDWEKRIQDIVKEGNCYWDIVETVAIQSSSRS
jgi:hypothetical protein